MKKKVMVTGAAGLIGSHLIEKLLSLDYEVHGLDIVDIKTNKNLEPVKKNNKFFYYKGDVRSLEDLNSFFQNDASVLYHLASVVGVNRYMEDPMSLIDIGILGTRNLINMCHKHNIRMLFTSTSEVYGKNPNIPWQEDNDRILGPTNIDRWSYSTSKALCEHMLFGVYHKDKWPMSIVRFFNVYGPRQAPIYVVSKSIHRVLNGKAPELYDGAHVLPGSYGPNDTDRSKSTQKKDNTFRPLINVDKKGVAEHYSRLGVLEDLFPLTRSCEEDNVYTFEEHCGDCWFCRERKWGFGRLV